MFTINNINTEEITMYGIRKLLTPKPTRKVEGGLRSMIDIARMKSPYSRQGKLDFRKLRTGK